MIDSPAAAVRALADRARRIDTEDVSSDDWLGRVLATPLLADRPNPPASVSAMDGFCLRAADAALGSLPLAPDIRIGEDPGSLPPGSAARIVTGAPIPAGADTVVPVELVSATPQRLTIPPDVADRITPGTHIRRKGENLQQGDQVLPPGTIITPAAVAALATFGAQSATVAARVRTVVIATGDELKAPAEDVSDFQIRDSNSPAVASLLAARPWIDVVGQTRVPDDPELLATALTNALQRADLIVCTGGVSMGHRDHIPDIIKDAGADVLFHRIPQRPGKPILGAATDDGRIILGLPGNPVSALVTCRRIAIPVAAAFARASLSPPPAVTIASPDQQTLDLWWFRPVSLVGPGRAEFVSTKGSGDIPSAARADGFVELPPGATGPGPWPLYLWNITP